MNSKSEIRELDDLRLLVIERETGAQPSIVQMLRANGANVVAVGSVQEGLTAVEDYQPDVLISEVHLPDGDGYTLVDAVRSREHEQGTRRVPAIAITASPKEFDLTYAVAVGFQRYLSKPIEPKRLVAIVVSLANPKAA